MSKTAFAIAGYAAALGMLLVTVSSAAIIDPDGTIHACYNARSGALRVVDAALPCAKGELPIQWSQRGPQGDPGLPGPASLEGIPCDTGSPDKPDGRTTVAVDAATGLVTLRCESASTNPLLTVALEAGPQVCTGFGGITVCFLSRFAVEEVDASGTPVPNGFTCSPATNLSPFPQLCTTQRFATGTTVRLRATAGVGTTNFVPSWTGCDAVDAATCTFTLTAERIVGVVPVAP